MPIEIKELVIKAEVREDNSGNQSPQQNSVDTEKIISECIDRIMEIIKDKQER